MGVGEELGIINLWLKRLSYFCEIEKLFLGGLIYLGRNSNRIVVLVIKHILFLSQSNEEI